MGPVDDKTATLPQGWRGRLVTLPPGDTDGVLGLCLDPHDLAIAKYVAAREKDVQFNRQLVSHGDPGSPFEPVTDTGLEASRVQT
jgi:hypothetical protein